MQRTRSARDAPVLVNRAEAQALCGGDPQQFDRLVRSRSVVQSMLLTMRAVASRIWQVCHGSGGVVLSFWKDLNGGSPARMECQTLFASWPREVGGILAHVAAVEAMGHQYNNPHLAQAQAYPARALPMGPGQLYWWEVNRVGAFYIYDGKDMVVVLMGRVSNPPTFGDFLSQAQGRV